jgi:AcrR family transcriptional regulator
MHPEAKPPRSSRTREEILRSARARFSADGYERTTIRAVAADASIDPSMVMRYYGNKSGLFAAATEFDLALPDLLRVPRENLGAAAVEHFLTRWEGEEGDDALRVLLASAATNPTAAAQMHSISARNWHRSSAPPPALTSPPVPLPAPRSSRPRCWGWRCLVPVGNGREGPRCRAHGRRFPAGRLGHPDARGRSPARRHRTGGQRGPVPTGRSSAVGAAPESSAQS